MKSNFIHVCFVIDESGSMMDSAKDILGGFKKLVDEQKANTEGTCAVSLYTFDYNVTKHFVGVDVNEVMPLDYNPGGMTALYDGIGTAITEVGQWLSNMNEDERPEKNLIVIMTDGYENSSRRYSTAKVREMIKHQEEKYNWTFMYLGADLTNMKDSNDLGIQTRGVSVRSDFGNSYGIISKATNTYRNTSGSALCKNAAFAKSLSADLDFMNAEYEVKTGVKVESQVNESK